VARVRREVAGRRGKQVTTAAGLPLTAAGLAELAAELKRRCGCGGSVKEGTVVLQGDVVEAVAAELAARGFRVRRG
jgi:translation initiation factor 1